MNAIPTTSLTLALLLSTALPTGARAPRTDPDAILVRRYDVAALARIVLDEDETTTPLLPALELHADEVFEYDDEEPCELADYLADQLQLCFSEEFAYGDRAVLVDERGRMLLVGPERLHREARALLGFLEGALHASTTLVVDVVELPADAGLDLPDATVADARTVLGQVDALARRGAHRRHRLQLAADRTAALALGSDRSLVVDYDPEVAHGSFVGGPTVGWASVGTRLRVRGAPLVSATGASDGLRLALELVQALPAGEVETREIVHGGNVRVDSGFPAFPSSPVFQNLVLENRSLALNTSLRAGEALVIRTRSRSPRGVPHQLVVLHLEGEPLPAVRAHEVGGNASELLVLNAAALAPPRCVAGGRLVSPEPSRHLWMPWFGLQNWPQLESRIAAEPWDECADFAADTESGAVEEVGPWLALSWTADTGADAESTARERTRVLERYAALAERPRRLGLALELVQPVPPGPPVPSGERGGERAAHRVLAALRAPVDAGAAQVLVLGTEELALVDYDVEIATEAVATDPIVASELDGLALWVEPSLGLDGRLHLGLRGAAHVAREPRRSLDLDLPLHSELDQRSFEHLFVDQRLVLEPGADGAWRAEVGQLGPDATGLALRVELRP